MGKSTQTKNRPVVVRSWGGGENQKCTVWCKASFCSDEMSWHWTEVMAAPHCDGKRNRLKDGSGLGEGRREKLANGSRVYLKPPRQNCNSRKLSRDRKRSESIH